MAQRHNGAMAQWLNYSLTDYRLPITQQQAPTLSTVAFFEHRSFSEGVSEGGAPSRPVV